MKTELEEPKMIECYFIPINNSISAKICGKCGKEKILHTIGEGIKVSTYFINPKEEPKKETIETKDINYWKNNCKENYLTTPISVLRYISELEKQQERMYSEEELKSAFKIGFNIGYGSPVQELDLKNQHCEKWFEQFKKK